VTNAHLEWALVFLAYIWPILGLPLAQGMSRLNTHDHWVLASSRSDSALCREAHSLSMMAVLTTLTGLGWIRISPSRIAEKIRCPTLNPVSWGIPTVGPVTGATSRRSPDARHVFFLRPTYREETQRLVKQIVDMGLKRIAVVYLDNPFGKEVLKDMSKALDDIKVERAGEYALAVDGKNGAELADKVAAERPGAVLLATTGTANTAFVQAFRAKAQGVPLAGLSVTVVASEMPKLAASTRGMALVQVFPDATSQKSVVVRKFQTTMKAVGANPAYLTSGSALEGWLNGQIMIEGLKNAGKDLTRERLRAGLANIRGLSFGDFSVGFGGKAPYIGSDAIYLAVYAENGRRIS